MPHLDLYACQAIGGFLLDVQRNYLSGLNTRVVVPLYRQDRAPEPARELNPVFEIAGQRHVMMTQFLAAVSIAELKAPQGSLAGERERVTRALDMVFSGF